MLLLMRVEGNKIGETYERQCEKNLCSEQDNFGADMRIKEKEQRNRNAMNMFDPSLENKQSV